MRVQLLHHFFSKVLRLWLMSFLSSVIQREESPPLSWPRQGRNREETPKGTHTAGRQLLLCSGTSSACCAAPPVRWAQDPKTLPWDGHHPPREATCSPHYPKAAARSTRSLAASKLPRCRDPSSSHICQLGKAQPSLGTFSSIL